MVFTCSTAAISDFHQKLQNAKGAKSQPLSEKLSTMVEARCAIRHLMNLAVTNRVECPVTETKYKETSSTADCSCKRAAELKKDLAELKGNQS